MMLCVVLILAVIAAAVRAGEAGTNSTVDLGMCGYSATCSAGGRSGVCVSIGSGCCNGGTATAGLCPGIKEVLYLNRLLHEIMLYNNCFRIQRH
jgi:hypothetical protein